MYAAVDLGSNSFRLHIGELVDGRIHIIDSARGPVRLAAGMDANNVLGPAAIERALACLHAFRRVLSGYQVDAVRVVATNTLRVARNAAQLLALAEQALGYPIDVISGQEEGRLIYQGVHAALAPSDAARLVLDIGGGSTEVIAGRGAEIGVVRSFALGTESQMRRFFADGSITASTFEAAVAYARQQFQSERTRYQAHGWHSVYGSSGSIRAILAALSHGGRVDGAVGLDALQALVRRLLQIGQVRQIDFPGVAPERVPVMLGGLTVLLAAMQEFGFDQLEAVDAGLRLGVLSELVAARSLPCT